MRDLIAKFGLANLVFIRWFKPFAKGKRKKITEQHQWFHAHIIYLVCKECGYVYTRPTNVYDWPVIPQCDKCGSSVEIVGEFNDAYIETCWKCLKCGEIFRSHDVVEEYGAGFHLSHGARFKCPITCSLCRCQMYPYLESKQR